jgi:hypothetical protein
MSSFSYLTLPMVSQCAATMSYLTPVFPVTAAGFTVHYNEPRVVGIRLDVGSAGLGFRIWGLRFPAPGAGATRNPPLASRLLLLVTRNS